jgi:glycine dehydrogenase
MISEVSHFAPVFIYFCAAFKKPSIPSIIHFSSMKLNVKYNQKFSSRHTGATPAETHAMLQQIGVASVDDLINETIPENIRLIEPLNTGAALTEEQFLANLKKIASKNDLFKQYLGQGYYNTYTPGVILRNITENPGWYTQYTPYQAEIAQGRLEALLNFQTMVIDLTGMEIANASLLDEATAAAEAMHMMQNLKDKHLGDKLFVDENTFAQTIDVLKTRCEPLGVELVIGKYKETKLDASYFGAYLQYPNNDGTIENYRSFIEQAHNAGAKVTIGTDLLALTILTPPGEFGADIVIGSSQRFGVPLGYGGPHAAFMATRDEFKRSMPGRIIGVSIDAQGNRALRMALQTREQHIRRDKATSNICTAQVLLSIMASMYAVYHGPEGLQNIALRTHGFTKLFATAITSVGYKVENENFFDTLRIRTKFTFDTIQEMTEKAGINIRYFADYHVGVSFDETTTLEDVKELVDIFTKANKSHHIDVDALTDNLELTWDAPHIRTSKYLQYEVFNSYHTEHEMLRYIKRLEAKDLSMVHSMIPLGSCTMKLNATTEMIPITWPEFNQLHPFCPVDQAEGYAEIFKDLEKALAEITGFEGTSLQPNAGAQGEYTGLLVIREYLKSIGQGHRNIALIPSSAHGTNPASAVMAGMKVIVTKCDESGNVDLADLKAKAELHKDDLACLMVTYPSTHGIFETEIKEITALIHHYGGQVYMDGANMNAQVGLTSPAIIGADVNHINLHKTFCIPHGGGGPGMGPICVAKHLVPFLPGHPVIPTGGSKAIHAVSAAPWGSASILLISYAYIKMMGSDGLTEATKYAILKANYIASRLKDSYKILFTGQNGRCAHEMILDTRTFKSNSGVEVEDIAKRLMDYGFHAPTVSFPVAGTLMIEPTESESKAELDKFCDAMIAIRKEIAAIENGQSDKNDNLLKNAPHTAAVISATEWIHPYSREEAAFPLPYVAERKFWPSVARINNTYGDRVLICTCAPTESYADENQPVIGHRA